MSWTRGHKLGHGSTATVYLATAHRSGEQFAVKSAELSHSEFLQREQRILSSISSPYVIGYRGCEITTEYAEDDGGERVFYNLLLDYIPGGTIIDEIRRRGVVGRMKESAVGSYTWQIVKALEYLHSNGIVHCDVKGKNILVGPGESVKLADFGCSKRVGSTTCIGGTPMFMAPEVARGEEQGFAGDIWGLGCAVIEMATGGGSPWTETDDNAVSAIYRVGYSDRVPEFPGWFSEQGKDFLDKCLRRDPNQRWTASQLLNHPFLAKFDNSTPESLKVPSFDSPTSILDNRFWNSVVSDSDEPSSSSSSLSEEDEIEEDEAEARGRIGRLGMDAFAGPSWEEDDCGRWITVRENCGEEEDSESLESDYSAISRSVGISLGGCKYDRNGGFGVGCNLGVERVRQLDGDVSLSLIGSQA
ncbi:Mitogen-activated protein kinase kinase kinase 17 [Linum grandiflorum]